MTISIQHVTICCVVNGMLRKTPGYSLIRVFQIALGNGGRKSTPSEGEWEILLGIDFFIRWWASEEEQI